MYFLIDFITWIIQVLDFLGQLFTPSQSTKIKPPIVVPKFCFIQFNNATVVKSLHSTLIPHSPKAAAALAATDENSLGVNFFMGFLKLSVFLQIDDSIHPPFLCLLGILSRRLVDNP